jgi:hypothetical protein
LLHNYAWTAYLRREGATECPEPLESSNAKLESQKIIGGKVNLYRRENRDNWQCSTFLNGHNWRVSTHEDSLGRAKDFAEDWYPVLRGNAHAALLPRETRRLGKKSKPPRSSSKKLSSSRRASAARFG